jgi:hypothetical protein
MKIHGAKIQPGKHQGRGLSRPVARGALHRGRIIVAGAPFAFLFGHGSICRRQLSAMHQPLPRPIRTHLWFPTVRRRGRSRSSTRLARLVAVHDRRARCVWFDRGAIVLRLECADRLAAVNHGTDVEWHGILVLLRIDL